MRIHGFVPYRDYESWLQKGFFRALQNKSWICIVSWITNPDLKRFISNHKSQILVFVIVILFLLYYCYFRFRSLFCRKKVSNRRLWPKNMSKETSKNTPKQTPNRQNRPKKLSLQAARVAVATKPRRRIRSRFKVLLQLK